MLARFKLTLFVTTGCAGEALTHLYSSLKDLSYCDYELEIVDVLKHPEQAQKAAISATPCLIHHTQKEDVFIRTVSDHDSVRKALGIKSG